MNAILRLLRIDAYILAIVGMVVLAAVIPARDMGKNILDQVVYTAIAFLFFIYRARISPQAIWTRTCTVGSKRWSSRRSWSSRCSASHSRS